MIDSPGDYYAVCNKERGYVLSYPQDRMGERTSYLIFVDELEARQALEDARNWCSADLKLCKFVVTCEDL